MCVRAFAIACALSIMLFVTHRSGAQVFPDVEKRIVKVFLPPLVGLFSAAGRWVKQIITKEFRSSLFGRWVKWEERAWGRGETRKDVAKVFPQFSKMFCTLLLLGRKRDGFYLGRGKGGEFLLFVRLTFQ